MRPIRPFWIRRKKPICSMRWECSITAVIRKAGTYERLGPDGMIALIFWGNYSYGTYDTRFMIERYVDLDERWLFDLAKDPEGRKPTVTWQTYNRGGVLYGSYDEMFISLLPRKVENPELKRILREYFRIRSEKVKVEESITVYKDAAERFGDE